MDTLRNRTQGFTMVNNKILKDKYIGQRERGMYATLCSLPDGWELSVAGLEAILPDGRTAITHSLNILEKCGYLVRNQKRVRGCITGTEWEIIVPQNAKGEQIFQDDISGAEEGSALLQKKTQGFTIINNNVIRGGLSLKERGMLVTLLSLPDGWRLSIKGLTRIMADGKYAIGQALKHLEEKGYLIRKQERDEDGKLTGNIWKVYNESVNTIEHTNENGVPEKVSGTENLSDTHGVSRKIRREKKVSISGTLKQTVREIQRFFGKRRCRKKKDKGKTGRRDEPLIDDS